MKKKFKKIANYANYPEAKMWSILLEKEGIQTILQSEGAGLYGSVSIAGSGGVDLLVPSDKLDRAGSFLDKTTKTNTGS